MANDQVDVCIVGSGAGGGPLALELGRAGFRVVVLEKGCHYKQEEFVHDEILNSRRGFFTPLPWEEPHLVRKGVGGKYEKSNVGWTANCVGGGTVHMSGFFYRFKPVDFRLSTTLGPVAGANIADWPISYAELSPFYDRAERELGVSGKVVRHPFAEPRSGPFPLPQLNEHPIAAKVDDACRALGFHPLPTARAILSQAYRERAACSYCALCGSYGCEVGAKSSTHAALLPAAVATGKVEIRAQCMAREIEIDASGRASSVVYLDPKGQPQRQSARVVVASCTAIESARLLLNSTSSRFPKGLANDNGLVGKNLMFSSFGQSKAIFRISSRKDSWPWLADPAPFVNRSVQDFYLLPDDKLGFRKAGTLGFMWEHPNPIYAAVNRAGVGKAGVFGKALKDRLRDYRDSKVLEFETYGEFLPTDNTFVGVDPSVKDKHGIPVAAISIDRHPLDLKATSFLVERGEEVLAALHPDDLQRVGTSGETTILQTGTCRFGNDPERSVLDRNCRAHSVPNLYVVDGSFMPTSGGVPVTLTIIANSFRVAKAMASSLRRG